MNYIEYLNQWEKIAKHEFPTLFEDYKSSFCAWWDNRKHPDTEYVESLFEKQRDATKRLSDALDSNENTIELRNEYERTKQN